MAKKKNPNHFEFHTPKDLHVPHETQQMIIPGSNGFTVDIDKGIAALIRRLWSLDVITNHCCEGYSVPEGEESGLLQYQQFQGYVQMKMTNAAQQVMSHLFDITTTARIGAPLGWSLSYDYHPHLGSRITFRFPKDNISFLCERLDDLIEVRNAAKALQDETPFCNECSGPFDENEWPGNQYSGHWDTCPNRVQNPNWKP